MTELSSFRILEQALYLVSMDLDRKKIPSWSSGGMKMGSLEMTHYLTAVSLNFFSFLTT